MKITENINSKILKDEEWSCASPEFRLTSQEIKRLKAIEKLKKNQREIHDDYVATLAKRVFGLEPNMYLHIIGKHFYDQDELFDTLILAKSFSICNAHENVERWIWFVDGLVIQKKTGKVGSTLTSTVLAHWCKAERRKLDGTWERIDNFTESSKAN